MPADLFIRGEVVSDQAQPMTARHDLGDAAAQRTHPQIPQFKELVPLHIGQRLCSGIQHGAISVRSLTPNRGTQRQVMLNRHVHQHRAATPRRVFNLHGIAAPLIGDNRRRSRTTQKNSLIPKS